MLVRSLPSAARSALSSVLLDQSTPPNDFVAWLQRRLDQGEAKLYMRLPVEFQISIFRVPSFES